MWNKIGNWLKSSTFLFSSRFGIIHYSHGQRFWEWHKYSIKVCCFTVFLCFCQMFLCYNEIQLEAFHHRIHAISQYLQCWPFFSQDLCNPPWHAVNQLLDQILTDGSPFLHNQCLEFARICGFLIVQSLRIDHKFSMEIKIWGVSWPRAQNLNVLFPESFAYDFCFMARHSIMLEKAFFITKLPFAPWLGEVALGGRSGTILYSWLRF